MTRPSTPRAGVNPTPPETTNMEPRVESPSTSNKTRQSEDSTPRQSRTSEDADEKKQAGIGAQVSDPQQEGTMDKSSLNGKDEESQSSTIIVDWEGESDMENPMNWTMRKKIWNVALVSAWTFLTPLASSMVAPGTLDILEEFHSTDITLGSFVVSIYILGYAVGPLIIAPMSEIYGRIPVYMTCNVLFIIWTLACAFAPNLGGLLVFRFFEGVAGVCSLTIGSGTISDLIPPERRGAFMSVYSMGPLLGPVVGPIAGAFLSEKEGWRWVFRLLSIAAGVMGIVAAVFMRETYPPVLLQRKVDKLKKETGNPDYRSKLDSGLSSSQILFQSILRPTKMLCLSPIVFLLSLFMAVVYGYLYLVFTTITSVYEDEYHWNAGVAGLSYLGIGVGMFLGLFAFALTSDRTVAMLMAKYKTERKPEYRLPIVMLGGLFVPIGLFWYGWSAQVRLHYIMPIIGTGWIGAGLILTFMPISTYLVDAFTRHAASAMAANTVLRSLAGAFLPLAGPSMYEKLGLGWGNSTLGFIALALWPVTLMFYVYGERIRTSKRFAVQF